MSNFGNWNTVETNRYGIKPPKTVGPIAHNGRLSQALVHTATTNTNALHGRPSGQFHDNTVVREADLVFNFYNSANDLQCTRTGGAMSHGQSDRTHVDVISTLNGFGDASSENNWDLMTRMNVCGVSETDTQHNPGGLLTFLSGGVRGVRNNSNQTIRTGDYIIAYVPTPEEAKHGGGNTRTPEEEAGVVKLWYLPYRPEFHRNQAAQLYRCLKAKQNQQDGDETRVLPAYEAHCQQFLDSVIGMAGIVMHVMWPALQQAMLQQQGPVDTTEVVLAVMRQLGHRDVATTTVPTEARQRLIDLLFVPFSVDSNNRTPFIHAGAGLSDDQKKMNLLQQQSATQFLESSNYFVNMINRLVIGQAKTDAKPGYDFRLELSSYSKKG
jgi:hypothetical protein